MQHPGANYPSEPYNHFSTSMMAGQYAAPITPTVTLPPTPTPHTGMFYPPPQGNWSYNKMQQGSHVPFVPIKRPLLKRRRELNPLRTERAKRVKAEGHVFRCETCEQDLVLVDFGNRTQEKLLRGMRKGLSCRACHEKNNIPNRKSQKKQRILNAYLRKPKPLEVVLIFIAGHANAIMEDKRKELLSLGWKFGVTFKMDKYIDGALERIGRVTGSPEKAGEAIKELARMKTEINGGKLLQMDFCIEETNLGGIVGRGGSNINKIRQESKAEVIIKGVPRLPNSSCVRMKICGTVENFGKAMTMVMERFHKNRVPIQIPYIPKAPSRALKKEETL